MHECLHDLHALMDMLKHDTKSVHVCIQHMKAVLPSVNKLKYFRDSVTSQYLCHIESDFGIPAKWHFLPHPITNHHVMVLEVLLNYI